MTIDRDNRPGARLSDYLELVRLPNIFTAMADVVMGMLFVWGTGVFDRWMLALLMAASGLLYAAGVVLNDVFDFAVDLQQRPERPLPSGRIALGAARHLGWQLLLLGLLPAWLLVLQAETFRPGVVAVLLAGSIVTYDAWLKRTPLGPAAMGACRMLNVLLGMSVTHEAWNAAHWLVAGGIGTYIMGVTWFARREAGRSHRGQLFGATLVALAGVGLLACFPVFAETRPLEQLQPYQWPTAMLLLGLLIAWQFLRAVVNPGAARVQLAVKQCILSLVVLDAAVVLAVRGRQEAVFVLLFLVPAVMFGRSIRST